MKRYIGGVFYRLKYPDRHNYYRYCALVAIIGGFLISRVIFLSSERNSIERRLCEIQNDLLAKEDMLKKYNLLLLEEDIEDFIRNNYKKILLEDKTLEQILNEDDSTILTTEEVRPYVGELKEILEDILSMIKKSNCDYIPQDFKEFMKIAEELRSPNITYRKEWYELVFDVVLELIPEEKPDNPWGFNFQVPIESLKLPHITSQVEIQAYRDKVRERDRLENEIHILKLQKCEQEKILGDYGKPIGLWSGLLVLAYACFVGIVYPSTLLPYPEQVYNDILTKWVILSLFFSQLLVLFIYLALSMYKLTKTNI